MIKHYYWPTPNGHKTAIMLEEVGVEYEVHPIDILNGAQFAPEFIRISPNNRIPAIVDTDGPGGKPYSVFEAGAILLYLAEKTGGLWPENTQSRYLHSHRCQRAEWSAFTPFFVSKVVFSGIISSLIYHLLI